MIAKINPIFCFIYAEESHPKFLVEGSEGYGFFFLVFFRSCITSFFSSSEYAESLSTPESTTQCLLLLSTHHGALRDINM